MPDLGAATRSSVSVSHGCGFSGAGTGPCVPVHRAREATGRAQRILTVTRLRRITRGSFPVCSGSAAGPTTVDVKDHVTGHVTPRMHSTSQTGPEMHRACGPGGALISPDGIQTPSGPSPRESSSLTGAPPLRRSGFTGPLDGRNTHLRRGNRSIQRSGDSLQVAGDHVRADVQGLCCAGSPARRTVGCQRSIDCWRPVAPVSIA